MCGHQVRIIIKVFLKPLASDEKKMNVVIAVKTKIKKNIKKNNLKTDPQIMVNFIFLHINLLL